jgi:hypothetical protein
MEKIFEEIATYVTNDQFYEVERYCGDPYNARSLCSQRLASENVGKIRLPQKSYDLCLALAHAAWEYPQAKATCSSSAVEILIQAIMRNGRVVKCKPDLIYDAGIYDLKTLGKPMCFFQDHALALGYHIQAGFYTGVLIGAKDHPVGFSILGGDETAALRGTIFTIPCEECLSIWQSVCLPALNDLARCPKTNGWEESPSSTITVPAAQKKSSTILNENKKKVENMKTSLEKHRQIVETLVHLIRPQVEIAEEGCDVWYTFSKEEYELLADRLRSLVAAARKILADVRKDLEGYASQCAGDDGMVDEIKGTLNKVTATYNTCKKMSKDLLTFLNNFPYRAKDNPKVYLRMPVDSYRMLVLVDIRYYTEMEWIRGTIIRGDEEENFTKKED